jgi:hypothetical protein
VNLTRTACNLLFLSLIPNIANATVTADAQCLAEHIVSRVDSTYVKAVTTNHVEVANRVFLDEWADGFLTHLEVEFHLNSGHTLSTFCHFSVNPSETPKSLALNDFAGPNTSIVKVARGALFGCAILIPAASFHEITDMIYDEEILSCFAES